MPHQRTWAEAAVSTLAPGPAVPDMATQARCETCGRVSAASDLRQAVADRFYPKRWVLWLFAAAGLLGALAFMVMG